MVTRDIATRAEVPEGAYVETVVAGSSAAKAGIQEGDIITQFDGQNVSGEGAELSQLIAENKVGDSVGIRVYRGESYEDLTAVLEPAPEQ